MKSDGSEGTERKAGPEDDVQRTCHFSTKSRSKRLSLHTRNASLELSGAQRQLRIKERFPPCLHGREPFLYSQKSDRREDTIPEGYIPPTYSEPSASGAILFPIQKRSCQLSIKELDQRSHEEGCDDRADPHFSRHFQQSITSGKAQERPAHNADQIRYDPADRKRNLLLAFRPH